MFKYNSFMIRYHNDYFKLSNKNKSLYKAKNFDILKNQFKKNINKKIKKHPFESLLYDNNEFYDIEDFLLSIGEDKVIVNNDQNSLNFNNLLDYDIFNYKKKYNKNYIFDLPYTEIKTLSDKGSINYKFSSIIYYLIDTIYKELLSNNKLNIDESLLNNFISDYLPTLYNDTLIKTKELKKSFLFKTYEKEKTINNILIPNQEVLEKVDFYKFNDFVKNNISNDFSKIEELKTYHKEKIINFLTNKSNSNVIFLKRK